MKKLVAVLLVSECAFRSDVWFCFRSGQQSSSLAFFGQILPPLPHRRMDSLASLFMSMPNISISANYPDPHLTGRTWMDQTSAIVLRNSNSICEFPFPPSVFYAFLPQNVFIIHKIVIHAPLFCRHCKAKGPIV